MKKVASLFTLAATAVLLAWSPAAKAGIATDEAPPRLVTPLDTFSFDVIAFNNTSGVAAYAVAPQDVTFGATTTLVGVGLGGSNVTITSSESVGVSTTTDTFTVSTPTNFAPTGFTIGGTAIQGLEFDIDQDTTFADPVNLVVPISSATSTGSIIYNTSTVFALNPVTTLLSGGSAYQAYEGVSTSPSINSLKVHSFTIAVTYATVPEPSSVALMGLGGISLLVGVNRLRRQA